MGPQAYYMADDFFIPNPPLMIVMVGIYSNDIKHDLNNNLYMY